MKRFYISAFLFFLPLLLFCQDVQWASKVVSFSTQLSDYAYAATQALGKPNVLPAGGDNPNAWMPSRPDRISEIKVGFDNPVKIQQIAIAESFHPGALYQLYLYDKEDHEYLLATFSPHAVSTPSRLMNIYVNETPYEVSAVRIVLDCSAVPGYNAIDAIGISASKNPIKVGTNLAFRKNPGRENNMLSIDNNKNSSDSRPFWSVIQNQLYFTRRNNPGNSGGNQDPEDIWQAGIDEKSGKIINAQNAGNNFNNAGPNTLGSIGTLEGKPAMIIGNAAGKNGKIQAGVFYSLWDGNNWMQPQELKIKNSKIGSWDADYFLSDDGKLLFIATERYDTEGGKDLYVCQNDGKGKFSEPMNLGPGINKAHDELSPFWVSGENTLYFATPGLTGFGKSDLFKSRANDNSWQNWSEPENLGSDINTPNDERYFSFAPEGKYAYFARDNGDSIYKIIRIERPVFMQPTPLVTLKGNITDKITGKSVNAQLSFLILPELIEYGVTVSNGSSGEYDMLLPSGNKYKVKALAGGYDSMEVSIALENQNRAYGYTLPLALNQKKEIQVAVADQQVKPVITADSRVTKPEKTADKKPASQVEKKTEKQPEKKPEKKMDYDTGSVNDIIFPYNSDVPIAASLPVIDKYIEFLILHKEIKIELAGFTDPVGTEESNLDLSVRRAMWVKNYMAGKGIEKRRVKVIGFGDKLLIDLLTGVDANQLNRRVEVNLTR
jgi:OOP family OmpA-OmpF porin